jgi:hypothetical protein
VPRFPVNLHGRDRSWNLLDQRQAVFPVFFIGSSKLMTLL